MEKITIRYRDTYGIQDLKKAHVTDAGFDIRVLESYELAPGERKFFSTGLYTEIPIGYEISIRPRSGLATKHGITIANTPATIDAGYRGEIKICLINLGDSIFTIDNGMRVAQLLVHKVEPVVFEEVTELSLTERGEGGFGSSGMK